MKDYSTFEAISQNAREIVMSRCHEGKGDLIASIMAVFGSRLQKRIFSDNETEKRNFLEHTKINLDGLEMDMFNEIFDGCYQWYANKHKNKIRAHKDFAAQKKVYQKISAKTNFSKTRELLNIISHDCHIYDCERIAFYSMENFNFLHTYESYDEQGYNILGNNYAHPETIANFLFSTMGQKQNLAIIEILSRLEQTREV